MEKSTKKFIDLVFEGNEGYIEVREYEAGNQRFFDNLEKLKEISIADDKNISIGIFSRDEKSGKTEHCLTTKALWADFDGMSKETIEGNLIQANIPLPTIWIFSGNGYHTYWLLKERRKPQEVSDILKAIAVNTQADIQATDIARVMRIPGSNNIKDGEVKKSSILEITGEIYGIDEFEFLKDKSDQDNIVLNEDELFAIKKDIKRPCIKSILNGVGEGQRNWAEGRLVSYFKLKGYSYKDTERIISKWNKLNNPSEKENNLKRSFYYYWKEEYKLLGCRLSNEELDNYLLEHCDSSNCKIGNSVKYRGERILLNGRIMTNIQKFSGFDLAIYTVLVDKKHSLTAKQIANELNCDRRTVYDSIKKLNSYGLVISSKSKGEPTTAIYKKQGTFGMGQIPVAKTIIKSLNLKELTPAEYKIYIVLCNQFLNREKCFPGYVRLGHVFVK
jgi:hypothetical protein